MLNKLACLPLLALLAACESVPPPPPKPCADCCQSYDDCQSLACDAYTMNSLGTFGRCVAEGELVYANNQNGACSGAHAGTREDPVCGLDEALLKLGGGRDAVRVAASSQAYAPITVAGRTLRVFGPYSPSLAPGAAGAIIGNDLARDALTVGAGASVLLDGVVLRRSRSGARCEGAGASLTLRRSLVDDCGDVGLDVRGCALVLDRVRVAANRGGAVSVSGKASYAISNSFFAGNTSQFYAALRFSDESTGRMRFSTVAGNGSIVPAGLACGQLPRDIEDSIVSGNTVPAGRDSQLSGACRLQRTVIGATDAFAGGVKLDPAFVKPTAPDLDYRLAAGAASDACCIDRAAAGADVRSDFFGAARPQRGGFDIGAHEAP